MAIIPAVEQIQGDENLPSVISSSDFGKVKVRAGSLLWAVRGADAWEGSSPASGYAKDAQHPGTRGAGPTA